MITDKELVEKAKIQLKNSYSPYSNFSVGAALVTKNGKIFKGANIENISYGATICAERVAIFNAISNGEMDFEKIAIVSKSDEFCYPCGMCRQVMSEFCDDNFRIIISSKNEIKSYTLSQLLPHAFEK